VVINEEREVPLNSDFTPFILDLFLRIKLVSSVKAFNMPTYTFQKEDAFECYFFPIDFVFISIEKKLSMK